MDNIYIVMLIALAILAIADLVVGVSNDAVNFLNSAIGSKAISFKTIMIVASVGIAFGALSSSGMMEVARKGIFVPGQFYFDEIMIIFMAVMITDILLLDFFNTLGLPTSTTVSIVFELLGAAVCVSLLKISQNGDTILQLGEYINSEKATEIILGILLSVVVAFTIGALVQFASRYLLTFHFEKKPSWMAAVFGGLAITAISYFIIIKGLKSAAVLPESFNIWAKTHFWEFIGINVVIWTVISGLVISLLKTNIYKLIIIVGTFALAMAFAGNDLVNFIGVPIGGLEAYLQMEASGIPPTEFKMDGLSAKVETNPYLLLLAGIIMIATLWFSEKARRVVKTSVDLSSQDETEERFRANWLSQNLVRGAIVVNTYFTSLLPKAAKKKITNSFTPLPAAKIKDADTPAFDMVRASINLVVASVLISIATGMKLPLSTTYVTFMVAMGTSLADRAWGSDSAVYRVAGVINVIAGWFMTAFTAFVAAAIMAFLLYKFGGYALAGLLTLALFLIIRSYVKGSKDTKDFREEIRLQKAQSSSIKGIIDESSGNVSMVMKMGSKLLSNTFMHLAKQDLKALKKDRLYAEKLSDEMEGLKSHVFFYIKNLDEESTAASKLYLLIQDLLQDIVQSFSFITKTSYKHVKNNHRGLRYNQIKGLNEIESKLVALFKKIKTEFDNKTLDNLPAIIDEKQALLDYLSNEVEQQIERTKDPEASAKNTSLYFSILLECKDLVEGTTELLEKYYVEYTHSKSTDIL